jgi:hypothetical protein
MAAITAHSHSAGLSDPNASRIARPPFSLLT